MKRRDDKILVKFITFKDATEVYLTSYYTVAINETFNMFLTALKYQVPCEFNKNDETVPNDYRGREVYIEDVWLGLGSKDCIPVIEVILE